MASRDLINTKPTILGATLGAIPGIAANPPERFSFAPAFSERFFKNWGGPRAPENRNAANRHLELLGSWPIFLFSFFPIFPRLFLLFLDCLSSPPREGPLLVTVVSPAEFPAPYLGPICFLSLFFPDGTKCRVDFEISITHACGRNLLLRVWRNTVGNKLNTGLSLHSNPSMSLNPKPSNCNGKMWIANFVVVLNKYQTQGLVWFWSGV